MSKNFKIGDTVYSPDQGIGTIESEIEGKVGDISYTAFHIPLHYSLRPNLTSISIPPSKADRLLLPVADSATILQALISLEKPAKKRSGGATGNWSRNENEFSDILRSGNLAKIASLYKDLISLKELPFSFDKFREQALKNLVANMILGPKISESDVYDIIEKITKGTLSAAAANKKYLKVKDLPMDTESGLTIERRAYSKASPRASQGRHAKSVKMQIDESKIDFSLPQAAEKLAFARKYFKMNNNHLVVYSIYDLYKEEHRALAIDQYTAERGVRVASVKAEYNIVKKSLEAAYKAENPHLGIQDIVPLRTSLRKIFEMNVLSPETKEILSRNKQIKTLGEIFNMVNRTKWTTTSGKNLHLSPTEATILKEEIVSVVAKLNPEAKPH